MCTVTGQLAPRGVAEMQHMISDGRSNNEIAQMLHVSKRTVTRHRRLGVPQRTPRVSSSRSRSPSAMRKESRKDVRRRRSVLKKLSCRGRTRDMLVAALVDRGFVCSRTTVSRDLKALKVKFFKARRAPRLTPEQMEKRVKFCRRILREPKKDIMFSDEKIPRDIVGLRDEVVCAWKAVPRDKMNSLVASFYDRCRRCVEIGGEYVQ